MRLELSSGERHGLRRAAEILRGQSMYADAGKQLGGPLAHAIAHDAEVYAAELLKLARLLERLATRAGRDRKPAK